MGVPLRLQSKACGPPPFDFLARQENAASSHESRRCGVNVYDMKRILAAIAMVTFVVLVNYRVRSTRDSVRVDAGKILIAARQYAAGLEAKGIPVPASIPAKLLIDQGLLPPADVSGFTGAGVSVNLTPDQSRPRDVLFWAKGQNGTEFTALVDGSVQQVRK